MRTRSFGFRGAGVVAAVMLAACNGGGESGGSCGQVSPCGGSLVGTWSLRSVCQSIADFVGSEDCPGASLDESMVVASGAFVFNADMTYTVNSSVSGTRKFKAPLACVSVTSCDEYAGLISPGPPTATTTCTLAGTTCDCTMVYSMPEVGGNPGTYSTSGTVISWAPTGGIPSDASYCVQGNTLYINDIDGTIGIVATR